MSFELTKEQVKKILTAASDANIDKYLPFLNETFKEFNIDTPLRVAAFIAQTGHESGQFATVEENLNYSANALLRVFSKYFPTPGKADLYARKPVSIGNLVYANRMGNGDEASGDGYRYRGRGLIQITGKNNYVDFFLYAKVPQNPDYLTTPKGACQSAGWFWWKNQLNTWADKGDIKELTRRINGGYNGLEERTNFYNRAVGVLNNAS